MKEPMKPLFAEPASSIKADGSEIFTWWTIAPSSVDFYGSYSNTIPGWDNSILVTSLKYGLYRLELSASGTAFVGDTIRYMSENRVRDVAINPHGDTLYFAIDKTGSTSGPTGGFSGAKTATSNPGYILRMVYLVGILPVSANPMRIAVTHNANVKVFPNPASKFLYVDSRQGMTKPFHYQLLDMTGKLIIDEKTSRDSFSISIEKVKPGIYIFKLMNGYGGNVLTKKLVVR
jgi:hypothetical protein